MTQQTVDPLLQAFPVLLPEPGRFQLPLRCRQKVLQKQNLLLPFRFGNQSVFIEKRQFDQHFPRFHLLRLRIMGKQRPERSVCLRRFHHRMRIGMEKSGQFTGRQVWFRVQGNRIKDRPDLRIANRKKGRFRIRRTVFNRKLPEESDFRKFPLLLLEKKPLLPALS